MKRPIVIDCDPGIDDAFALMLLASRPEFDIRAINPVAGNVAYRYTSENALRLKDCLGLTCRVGRGADKPLIIPFRDSEGVHGENGMGTLELPPAKTSFDSDYAWDILWQEAQRADGELEVVALGPLTNIAIALLRYPALAKKIKRLTIMGGTAHVGNTNAYAEFNIWVDPHACEIVLKSGVPIAMCGLDGCITGGLTPEEFMCLAQRDGKMKKLAAPLAEYLVEKSRAWGNPTIVVHDLITMACAVNPAMANYKACFVQCETDSSLSAGQTVVDLYRLSGQPSNVDFLLDVDKTVYMHMLGEMMDYYGQE